jgi:hypothetical protein
MSVEVQLPPFRNMLTYRASGWSLRVWAFRDQLVFSLYWRGREDPVHEVYVSRSKFVRDLAGLT